MVYILIIQKIQSIFDALNASLESKLHLLNTIYSITIMRKRVRVALSCLCAFSFLSASGEENTAVWFSSTEGKVWEKKADIQVKSTPDKTPDVEVYINRPQQTFKGWGTCFNELCWDALNRTSEKDHKQIMERFFASDGDMGYTYCRIPIGANDYARSWYSSNETKGDFAMERFNISRDKQTVIPYIKEALAENPHIGFWASPWSPPSWMKTNGHYANRSTTENGMPSDQAVPTLTANQFIQQPEYLEAYALYFSKFIDAYKAEGINISMIMYQNEAYTYNDYPNCTWLPDGTVRFNVEYLVPHLKKTHPEVEVFLGTMNTGNLSVFNGILSDSRMASSVDGIGFQWEGLQALPQIRQQYPNYRVMQTESECGSGTFNWGAAQHTFNLITEYLYHGAEAYTFWNMILQDKGTSTWGWNQNALVRVNSSTGAATYTPEYYAVKHFCNIIRPGSVILETNQSATGRLLAALLPDGKVAVVFANHSANAAERTVKIGDKYVTISAPALSFNSVIVDAKIEIANDKTQLSVCIAEANTLYGAGTGQKAGDLQDAILAAEEVAGNAVFQTEINQAASRLKTAMAHYQMANAAEGEWVDVTALLANPNFDEGTAGWIRTGSGGNFVSSNATEFWHTVSTLSQTLPSLPAGRYALKARAFVDGGTQAFLFADADEVALPKKEASDASNNLTAAAASLAGNEGYEVSLDHSLLASGAMKIGVDSRAANLWTVFDSFRLYYSAAGLDAIKATLTLKIEEASALYLLSGSNAEELQTVIEKARAVEENADAISQAITALDAAIHQYQLANASADQPYDMTSLIQNPSFESSFTGWVNNGMATSNNEHLKTKEEVVLKDGTLFVEKWVDSGKTVATPLGVSQTISGLPAGAYRVKAAAFSLYRNLSNMPGDDSPRKGGLLFANEQSTSVDWREEYEVTGTVVDGTLTFGFKVEDPAAGLNWVGCDNFRLYYLGADPAVLKSTLTAQITEAKEYSTFAMKASVASLLSVAISQAESAVVADPLKMKELEEAAKRLTEALAPALASSVTYASLHAALEATSEVMESCREYAGYSTLEGVYEAVGGKYSTGEYDNSGVRQAVQELKEAEKTCRLSQSAPFDATFILANPSFEETAYNVAPKVFIPASWELDYAFPADKDARLSTLTPDQGLQQYNIWANRVGHIDLYQDVTLPKGTYTLSAVMRSRKEGASREVITDQHLYVRVNGEKESCSDVLTWGGDNVWNTLTVEFSVPADGAVVRIGAASAGSGSDDWGGWFQVDNFKLNLVSHDPLVGLDTPLEDDQIVKTEYYNMQGMKISHPTQSGAYIRKITHASRRMKTEKVIVQ